MPTARTLVKKVRDFRVDEQREARANPDLNLLARYPAFLDLMHRIIGGGDEASSGGSPELFQPESLVHLVEEVRSALQGILDGPTGRAAVDDIQDNCWDLLSEKGRHALGPAACQGVGELAVRDAMLVGVSFWLRDHALARPSRAPRAASKPRSEDVCKHV